MSRFLLLRVRGGLCNRLQGLLSGSDWATVAERRLKVAWPTNGQFGAKLGDLFEHPFDLVSPVSVKIAARCYGGYFEHDEIRLDDPRRVLAVVWVSPSSSLVEILSLGRAYLSSRQSHPWPRE